MARTKKTKPADTVANVGYEEQLRVAVKRILRKYGRSPDKQERAAQLVLEQAEIRSAGWAG